MNFSVLASEKIQRFILENLHTNITNLLLKKPIFEEITNKELAQQILGRNVALKKFPFLAKEKILFPPQLNLEQASSEFTAAFKGQNLEGNRFLDLTCGFGIDAFFLSKQFKEVTLVEQNADLLALVRHNWQELGREATFVNQHLEDFLSENTQRFDCIYLDPARRDLANKKKFLLEDLSPNVLEISALLWNKTDKILLKLSPLIDLKYLLTHLDFIERIDIIAVKNEVKEIFVLQNRQKKEEKTLCRCINLLTNEPIFSFYFENLEEKEVFYSFPKDFLYIPNNSLLKSGAFNLISTFFDIEKLHFNTHLYTSDRFLANFPGRILKISTISAQNISKNSQYNVISKNYPLTADQIKNKYKIKDGGTDYLIFTQSVRGKEIMLGTIC